MKVVPDCLCLVTSRFTIRLLSFSMGARKLPYCANTAHIQSGDTLVPNNCFTDLLDLSCEHWSQFMFSLDPVLYFHELLEIYP